MQLYLKKCLEEALWLTCNLFSKEAVIKPYELNVWRIHLLEPAKLKKKNISV